MGESQDRGRFVWYELMTTDTDAAERFYKDVIGWTVEPYNEGAKPYTMWFASQGPLGGMMQMPEEAAKMGVPPQWMANVTVTDVDATVTRVKELGGQIHKPAEDLPNIGRFAVIADPQGAPITVFKPAMAMAAHDTTKMGEFTWNELATTDAEAALRFYSELFGWEKIDAMDMGAMGPYLIWGREGKPLGGTFKKPEMMPVSMWIYYIHVADLDAAIERAKAGGGKLINGPTAIPGGDRIAQLLDPQGAMFALHEVVAKATA